MRHSSSGDGIDRLRRQVTEADDHQLRRIVRIVDALADRSAADALIAPLRPRLAAIRPARPLRLARLIFIPLEPLIVARNRWQPGEPGIPRTALQSLGEAAVAGLGEAADDMRRRVSAHHTSDIAVVAEVGEVVWPAAAAALRTCPPPRGWARGTGLGAEDFEALARPIAALLEHGSVLHALSSRGALPAPGADPEALLGAVAPAGEDAVAMLLALLLQLLPSPAALLGQGAVRLPPSGRAALDRALEFVLDELDEASAADAGAAPDLRELARGALLIRELRSKAGPRPTWAPKLRRIERNLDGLFRREFGAAAAFVAGLPQAGRAAAPSAGPLADRDINDMETTARELRQLEWLGRGLGGASYYDAALRQTADSLAKATGLSVVDRLRLAEILLGPDAADVLASEILEAPTG